MKQIKSRMKSNESGSRAFIRFWSSVFAVATFFLMALVASVGGHGTYGLLETATAAPPEDPGGGRPDNPGGGDGDGGGRPDEPPGAGKPDNPGGGGGKPAFPGRGSGTLYSDLVLLYRDDYGRPILVQRELLPEEEGETSPGTVFCLQPVTVAPIPGLESVTNPVNGKQVSLVPLGTGLAGEECDVSEENAALTQEVLFGRLNLGRSPTKVLAQQLREVTSVLASSDAAVQIDEAGRFVWYDETGAAFEVDSPGNNLALHKELQVFGLPLTSQTNVVIPLPNVANPDDETNFLDHAAAALGAAAGKGDLINSDLVVYNNRILNIANETAQQGTLSTIAGGVVDDCPTDLPAGWSVDDECQYGEIGPTGPELYINYSMGTVNGTAYDFQYTRSEVFPGCVRGYLADFPTPGTTTAFSGTIMNCVFGEISSDGVCSGGQDFSDSGLYALATRADDARRVIAFTHDNVVTASTAVYDASVAGVDQAGQDLVCDTLTVSP